MTKYVAVSALLIVLCGIVLAQVAEYFPGPIINCPACGSEAVLARKGRKVRVECVTSGCLRGPKCRTADEAVCLWNAQIAEAHQGD